MKIKTKEFIDICKAYNCNASNIQEHLSSIGINLSHQAIYNRFKTLRERGLLSLDSGNTVSTGELLKGTSTLYDEEGKVKLQWVKTDVAQDTQLQNFREAVEEIVSDTTEIYKPILKPTNTTEDMMSIYTIGDAHIGLLAWQPESGADHDLKIAEKDLIKAMSLLVQQSLPTKEAFIVDVGDWFHSDNADNRTARGGNALDVEGRYAKVLNIGLMLSIRLIEMALEKHEIVRWRSAIGNHNEHSAIMMSAFISAWFRNEPRVIIHDTPNMFMYHLFGKNLIGITHGHTTKTGNLGEIMSVDCEDIWSESKYRYWYVGHIHHDTVKEYRSCKVESFRTLAGKDAWHSASGYRSGQDMKCITLHKDYGEVTRNTVSLALIRDSFN